MNIVITGGTGFIGRILCQQLVETGHQLRVLSRRPDQVSTLCGKSVVGFGSFGELEADYAPDAVINLAGEPIADKRWSDQRKQVLLDSRIGVTEALLAYLKTLQVKPAALISGSAIGFYGDQKDQSVDESTPPHDEFSHQLCRDWEAAALKARVLGIRVCIVRTGLVVGEGGGFLQRMLLPFKLGLGGPIGTGRQWMSWIHREDLVAMICWLLANKQLEGVFNGTAPNPVISKDFAKTLGRLLNRPAFMPVPGFVLELGLGEMSELLLTGQQVLPKRALELGFEFRYPQLGLAMAEALRL